MRAGHPPAAIVTPRVAVHRKQGITEITDQGQRVQDAHPDADTQYAQKGQKFLPIQQHQPNSH